MEQPSNSSRRRDEPECSLREWALRAQIGRENTRSRRFSGSHIRSFREDARSFRSNITISSTASSPGYPPLKEEIDPSTYSFTTALKALQARSGYNNWECLSPEGFALNSKWNDAERYICNPLSGEVPMECLSAKTLSGRSFRYSLTNRVTMSAPLIYSNPIPRHVYAKPARVVATREDQQEEEEEVDDKTHSNPHLPNNVKGNNNKMEGTMTTRDVGTQSTPTHEISTRSPSPTTCTPSIVERSFKRCESAEGEDSPSDITNFREEVNKQFERMSSIHLQSSLNAGNYKVQVQVQEKGSGKEVEARKPKRGDKADRKSKKDNEKVKRWSCSGSKRRQGINGCLFWTRKRGKDNYMPCKKSTFLLSLQGC